MTTKLDSLEKLFEHELRDLYSAESQLMDALPKLESAVSDESLRKAIAEYREQTHEHIERLKGVLNERNVAPGGHRSVAMAGILQEAEELARDDVEAHVRDAAIVSIVQRVEHLSIAGYGTARAFADQLGHHEIADTLQRSLQDEAEADSSMSGLANRWINFMAARA